MKLGGEPGLIHDFPSKAERNALAHVLHVAAKRGYGGRRKLAAVGFEVDGKVLVKTDGLV